MTDRFLVLLVSVIEAVDKGGPDLPPPPITLMVGGLLVSGRLISEDLFLASAEGGAVKDALDKARARSGQAQDPPTDEPPEFIHLTGARFWVNANCEPLPRNGTLWRGRLDAVDGWFLGELVAGPAA